MKEKKPQFTSNILHMQSEMYCKLLLLLLLLPISSLIRFDLVFFSFFKTRVCSVFSRSLCLFQHHSCTILLLLLPLLLQAPLGDFGWEAALYSINFVKRFSSCQCIAAPVFVLKASNTFKCMWAWVYGEYLCPHWYK